MKALVTVVRTEHLVVEVEVDNLGEAWDENVWLDATEHHTDAERLAYELSWESDGYEIVNVEAAD